jgi:outer membrane autotransporter protein
MRSAMRTSPSAPAGGGHVFAAFHSTNAGSSAATDGSSYNLDMQGGVAGVRYRLSPDLQFGAMLGSVDGDIEGSLIDTDAHGFMIGVFGEYLLDADTRTTAFASLGLGTYSYDATRQSFGGPVYANNIDSTAGELALGLETVAWQNERIRIMPRGAFRYLDGHVNGFRETGPGVRMGLESLKIQSLLFELGVDAEYDLNARTVLRSHLGVLTDLLGSGHRVSGSYLGGGLPVGVTAPGIDSDAVILGLGASFDVNESTRLDLNWRSEFRDDSQHTHLLSLGGRVTF